MTDTVATCQKRVSNGPRSVSFHACGRPVKDEDLCSLHLAGKQRSEQNRAERDAAWRREQQRQAAAEHRVKELDALGVRANVEYAFDIGRRRFVCTGGVTLDPDNADALIATLDLTAP